MNDPESIYADGGVIGPNPSKIGITWCFLHVSGGEITLKRSGVITPADLDVEVVSNNDAEALAAIRGLESVSEGWRGTLYTDSMVTRQRLLKRSLSSRLPPHLKTRVVDLQKRALNIVLVAGHPTKDELVSGVAKRNGLPVSKFNVECDRECTRIAKLFLEDL